MLASLTLVVLACAGCGSAVVSSASGSASPAPTVDSAPGTAGATASVAPSPGQPTASPDSAPTPSSATASSPAAPAGASVTIDPSLLAVLPATVGGLPIAPVDEPTGTDDPDMAKTVERLAQAIAIDPASGDFAYSSVIALKPGVFGTEFFDTWRASFDEGACSQSGGIDSHATTTIAGRTVFIATCQGGVTTYHVRLKTGDRIVSISSFGEHRLGERILADLRP